MHRRGRHLSVVTSYHDLAAETHGKPNDLMHHRSRKCPAFLWS